MATVASYRRALERLYTLIGREFALVVVSVNQDQTASGPVARELLLVARSMSTETSASTSTRQVIRGPVVRIDINGETPVIIQPTDIQNAFGGRSIPTGTPLMIAFVGVKDTTITRLNESSCKERVELASGGYMVLSYATEATLSSLDLCDKVVTTTRRSVVAASIRTEEGSAKFLIGNEVIDDTRNITYAIRIPPPCVVAPRSTPLPVRVVRAARWQPQETGSRSLVQPVMSGPEWESRIQTVVERELTKILKKSGGSSQEQSTIELGDGLVVRAWPDLLHRISLAREWNSAFTHQSVDPTPRANYEAFETLGDKVLSLALVHYLFSDDRTILDSNGLTDSHKEILSSVRQPAMAVVMGLNQPGLIRSTVSVDDKMLEDVYEAFFGCLFTVANRLTAGTNQGLPLCELLFKTILHESFPELDPWSVPKDPQTTLDQIFIRLGWGHPILSYNEESKITVIRLTREAFAHLENLGQPIRFDKPLAIGPRASDKASSARAAAEIALNILKVAWGIDTRYASMVVRNRLMKDERYASVQREALKIAEKMGFTDIYVARRAKNHNQLYAVMGVKPNDSEVQLHIYKYENTDGGTRMMDEALSTRVAAYITALRGFISSH